MTFVSGYRHRAPLAFGGLVIVAGTVLGSAPMAWADPTAEAIDAIDARYAAFGGEGSLLGAPAGAAVDVPGGAARDYQGGTIYYSKDTGAHVMYGAILDRYRAVGGPGSELGFPKNDESDTGDGTGRFNDFSSPGGASIYWTPQWGASVIKGKVLEAWRQSGGVTGPFGYPSADTSVADGVQTGKFVGPEGTEIQWSQAAGLVTIPAALAAKIPGFAAATPTAEGTTSVTKPSVTAPAAPEKSMSSKWWWIPVGLAVVALLGGLVRLLRRRPEPEPARVVKTEVRTPTPPPPPRPAPVAKAPAPKPAPAPAPQRPPAPKPAPAPAPAKVVPLAKAPTPPTPPPPPPPAPKPVVAAPPPPAPRPVLSEPPKATIRTEAVEHDVAPVIRYETQSPAETTIKVTYVNNAVGDDEQSRADKSDLTPDHLQD